MEIIRIINHKITESTHIYIIGNNRNNCNNNGNYSANDCAAHKRAHAMLLKIINVAPFICSINMAADNDSFLNLTGWLPCGNKVMAGYFFIHTVHKLLIHKKFHNRDEKADCNQSAHNALSDHK